jgi:hypothetical protein
VRQSPVQMERNIGVEGTARLEPPCQRGGDHRDLIAERGVVVLDDLGAPLHDADELERDDQVRLVTRVTAEVWLAHLGLGEEGNAQGGANVQSVLGGGASGHDYLVQPGRIGHAAPQHRDPVRGEVLGVAARAALEGGWCLAGNATRRGVPQDLQGAVKPDDVHRLLDFRDPGHGRSNLLGVPRSRNGVEFCEHLHIRWVGASQVGREGGLRTSSSSHRGEGDAAHEANEHDQREVPGPAPTEGGPEPVEDARMTAPIIRVLPFLLVHARKPDLWRRAGRCRSIVADQSRATKVGTTSSGARAGTRPLCAVDGMAGFDGIGDLAGRHSCQSAWRRPARKRPD